MLRKIKNFYHLLVAIVANIIYRFPAKQMTVIGVTGTDGKTTTSHMIYHLLKKEGMKVSLVSTLSALIDGQEIDTGHHVTTPDSFTLQKYIRRARDKKNEYLVLEVTSHAIDQHRVFGIPFTLSVLTNVTHEHLDYHKNYESYAKVKFRLLEWARTAVVNRDDRSYELLSSFRKSISKTQYLSYGTKGKGDIDLKEYPFVKKFPGVYNWYNGLAAVSVGKFLGISKEEMEKHFASFKLPKGRMEIVYDDDFRVIVDFAHTPHALEELLKTVRLTRPNGRIIHVFGSAGERDASKRPFMGKVSGDYADVVILTSEDPRGESPAQIASEIESGINKKEAASVVVIESRKQAILNALEMAQTGDVVLITGKGHEDSMNFGKGEESWSDQEVVLELLNKINEK